ncbi:hypothetical protein [Streptococcus suis]|uniref:hypothetical protein n=1 Tax=Streptococcus suis TaxID=1307 RepID=UPI00390886B2
MREDKKMNAHVTKSGYKYYTPRKTAQKAQSVPQPSRWQKGVKWLGKVFLKGLKNLPDFLVKVAITPILLLMFIINLVKCLLVTAIGWVVLKFVVVLGYAAVWELYAWLTNTSVPDSVGNQMDWLSTNFFFPHGVPIYYWWETTIIVVLAVITALSLTLHPNEV